MITTAEGPLTLFANVGLLAGVNAPVALQLVAPTETLLTIAHLTSKGPLLDWSL